MRKVYCNRGDGQEAKLVLHPDGEHMRGSLHYNRLAIDLNLFVDGEYITDGGHPAYQELGSFWKSLDELCAWGGDFGDANHFSIRDGGKM